MRLALNGRFLFRPVTGVERLALELGRAIAGVAAELLSAPVLSVAIPSNADPEDAKARLGLTDVPVTPVGRHSGQVWEQIDLAKIDRSTWLLDFCNLGPLARRRQALIVCDAQVYHQPQSYSFAFRIWYRLITPLLARRASALFTISHFSRRELEETGAFPADKATVLRLGVDHIYRIAPDPTVLNRHGLATGSYVLAIGSLAPHKNLHILVSAFQQATVPSHVRLVIAGGGNERIFANAGLPTDPRIHYLGRVSDQELRALYDGALAFACPALTEGFGMPPLEAMACGCPTIATTGGAVPEVCGNAALYADPHRIDEWAKAITTMTTDTALRERLAVASRRHAASFRWRTTAIQLLEVLACRDDNDAMLADLHRLREAATNASDAVTPSA